MKPSPLADRYARAFYNLVGETENAEAIYEQLRVVAEAFAAEPSIAQFVGSPLVRPAEKTKVIEALNSQIQLSETLKNFLLLLARKNRLAILGAVVTSFQLIADEAHGVTRGTVRSATVLGPEERQRLTELVSRATKKQVILTYKEDPSLLGGLVAEVGSFTFDDSLVSHLNRMNEQLNRSAH